MSWMIVELQKQRFALPVKEVRELVIMPEATAVPGSPAHMRGVMNLRGRVMPVIDLRQRLGMTSRREEIESFCAMMEQRQEDHLKWLAELDACLREDREFKLATDPRFCAFGKWYYSYKSDEPWITALLRKFEEPHRKIHATAAEAFALKARGDRNGALDLIEERRHSVLSRMIELFTNLRKLVRETQKEIAVVLDTGKNVFAVAVDAAVSLETFGSEHIEPLTAATDSSITQVGRKGPGERPVLLLATDPLF